MTVTHPICTDLVRRGVTPRVYAMQFDGNTRVVELTLTALGEPWTPPTEAGLALSYRKADNTRGFYNQLADGTGAIDVRENRVSVTLAPQVLTAPGIVEAALVMEAGGQRVAAFPFEVHVAADPSAGKGESDDYFSIQGGSAEALLYTAQTLTEAQQAQARANIAAASGEDMDSLGITTIPGKNLFNVAAVTTQAWADFSSGILESYPDNPYIQGYCRSEFIPVTGGACYTFSDERTRLEDRQWVVSHAWYDAEKKYISGLNVCDWTPAPYVLTAPANAAYIIINLSIYDYTLQVQLEKGESVTAYAPYGPAGSMIAEAKLPQENILYRGGILHLPKAYSLVVGDTFELFYKGVMLCKDPYAYNIQVTCPVGKAYSRKYVFTPTEAGTHTMSIQVTDDFGNIIDTQSTQLVVSEKMASPGSNIHVLCLGDSLTAGGEWVDEVFRRLTKTTSVTQHNAAAPTGDGLGNITFVGKKTTKNGAGYEGIGGWKYSNYMDAGNAENPFVYNGKVDFDAYCADLGISKIDRCHILLGWNMAWAAEESWKADAKALIDLLIAHNSAIKIVLLGLQIPAYDGLGTNYGANGTYANYRGLQEYVFHVDRWNNAIAAAYPGNVSCVSIAGQFDTENNMPAANTQVNTRNTTQVKQQNNGVHPDTPGYYQIADAVYRQFHRG